MPTQQQNPQPFQMVHHATPPQQNLQQVPGQGNLSLSLFPQSMLKTAQEHVKTHGIGSIPSLIDQNEQMICEILLKQDPNKDNQLKLTPEMKQELITFIQCSIEEAEPLAAQQPQSA